MRVDTMCSRTHLTWVCSIIECKAISSSIFQWLTDRERAYFFVEACETAKACSAAERRFQGCSSRSYSLFHTCFLLLLLLLRLNESMFANATPLPAKPTSNDTTRHWTARQVPELRPPSSQRVHVASHKQTTSVRFPWRCFPCS
jgi:hypothetical protein